MMEPMIGAETEVP
jgi:hypothetical protein